MGSTPGGGAITVSQVLARHRRPACGPAACPAFSRGSTAAPRVMLGVESFARHMSDEGWQLQEGLRQAGYRLVGRHYADDLVDVPTIVERFRPGTLIIQDPREWDPGKCTFDPSSQFEVVESLRDHPDIFRVTISKDSHQDWAYNLDFANRVGIHGWIVYYSPAIVCHLAPYIRPGHVIRTYHSLRPDQLPNLAGERQGCLISGAIGGHYPLRTRLAKAVRALPSGTTYHKHPGYHANGHHTRDFLSLLSKYRVAVCTASVYGYALRKIIEATACGCRVITDLPEDEVLPEIDGNLWRIRSGAGVVEVGQAIRRAVREYNKPRQLRYAAAARDFYDYLAVGRRLSAAVDRLRETWGPL